MGSQPGLVDVCPAYSQELPSLQIQLCAPLFHGYLRLRHPKSSSHSQECAQGQQPPLAAQHSHSQSLPRQRTQSHTPLPATVQSWPLHLRAVWVPAHKAAYVSTYENLGSVCMLVPAAAPCNTPIWTGSYMRIAGSASGLTRATICLRG